MCCFSSAKYFNLCICTRCYSQCIYNLWNYTDVCAFFSLFVCVVSFALIWFRSARHRCLFVCTFRKQWSEVRAPSWRISVQCDSILSMFFFLISLFVLFISVRNSSLRFFGIIYIFRRGLLSTLRIFFSLFNFCYQFYCMCTTKSAVHFYSFTSTTQRSIRNIK